MKSLSDLGKAMKLKALTEGHGNPYDDLSNQQLGLMIKNSNPIAYSDYVDDQTVSNVKQLMNYYQPNRGRFTAWWQRGKSEARTKLLQAVTNEQIEVIRQGALLEEAIIAGHKRQLDFEMFLAQHQHTLFQIKANEHLIVEALREGYTMENHQEMKMERERAGRKSDKREHKAYLKAMLDNVRTDNELRLQDNRYEWEYEIEKLRQGAIQQQVYLAQALSDIKIRETEQLEAIRMNNDLAMMKEKLRAAIIGKGIPHLETKMLAQEIKDRCYTEIENIENSSFSEKTKRRMIADRERLIDFFDNEGEDLTDE